MKVLIIENEFRYIQGAFEYVNDIYFENKVEFNVVGKSQDIKPFSSITNYEIVFLDISLAMKSELDGFGIITKMIDNGYSLDHVVILTGNHMISQKLISKGINHDFKVLNKPVSCKELLPLFQQKASRENQK